MSSPGVYAELIHGEFGARLKMPNRDTFADITYVEDAAKAGTQPSYFHRLRLLQCCGRISESPPYFYRLRLLQICGRIHFNDFAPKFLLYEPSSVRLPELKAGRNRKTKRREGVVPTSHHCVRRVQWWGTVWLLTARSQYCAFCMAGVIGGRARCTSSWREATICDATYGIRRCGVGARCGS